MKILKITLAFVFFSWISLLATNTLANPEVIPQSSPLWKELMRVAIKWKNAVLNKDIKVLVDYALPEYKESVSSKLRDQGSDMYRLFFKNKKSFYKILKTAKEVKIVLVKHKGLEDAGEGVSAYYYDGERIKLKFPLSIEKARELYDRGDIIEVFFFKDEGRWLASFELFK
jgi:hypothetical protein